MDFKTYLENSSGEIEILIKQYLEHWNKDEVDLISSQLSPLTDAFYESCLGGKRLRGMLVRLGYEMTDGKINSEIYKASAAVEIFQTAILAHDDIIDLSVTRRGKPTLYRKLGGDHYGISQTICLGDIGFFLSVRLISESNFSDDLKNQALTEFSKMFINTGLGEMLDIKLSQKDSIYNEQDVLTIQRLKTAYYTIIYPLKIGIILASGSNKLLEQIEKFGNSLGIAFQIQDDILGVFGDEEELGKSVTSDIEEGKNTLLIIEALKNASPDQKKFLEDHYGKGKVDQDVLSQIKQIFTDAGALKYSQDKSQQLVDQAKKVIDEMEINTQFKDLLSQMSDFIISRQK